jgi:hypothetical protein
VQLLLDLVQDSKSNVALFFWLIQSSGYGDAQTVMATVDALFHWIMMLVIDLLLLFLANYALLLSLR